MIGQHPSLFGLPELKLFCCATLGDLEASMPRVFREKGIAHFSPGLVRAVAELRYGDQSPRAVAGALEWLRQRPHWPGEAVLDVLQTVLAPRIAVEKSPENVDSATALARLAAAYPAARYLHLTRHPATSQQSMFDHWWRTMGAYPAQELAMACTRSWLETHRRILDFARILPDDRYLRIRGEDVLNEPAPYLNTVARWLGLAEDPAAIDAMSHPERSPFACFAPAGTAVPGGNDPGFLAAPIPHRVVLPVSLDPLKGWPGDPSPWPRVMTMAAELGYGVR